MNKKGLLIGIIAIVVIVIAIILAIVLNKSPKTEPISAGESVEKLEGLYELVDVQTDYGSMAVDIKDMKSINLVEYIELGNDGNGLYEKYGIQSEVTYTDEYIVINGENCPYTHKDGELKINISGEEYVFNKIDPSEKIQEIVLPTVEE